MGHRERPRRGIKDPSENNMAGGTNHVIEPGLSGAPKVLYKGRLEDGSWVSIAAQGRFVSFAQESVAEETTLEERVHASLPKDVLQKLEKLQAQKAQHGS